MGLVKCPDCSKEISDQAPACIHCGRPKGAPPPKPPPPKKPLVRPQAALLAAGGVLLGVGMICLFSGKASYATPALALGLAGILVSSVWSWWVKGE